MSIDYWSLYQIVRYTVTMIWRRSMQPNDKDKKDLFHTSAYAKVTGAELGASSNETFRQRRKIDRNRKIVHRYTGMPHIHPRPHHKQSDDESGGDANRNKNPTDPKPEPLTSQTDSNKSKPSRRPFNPYA